MKANLEYGHSKRVQIGRLRRQFRNEPFRVAKSIRVHEFRCTPSDGIPGFSDLGISLNTRQRLRLVLHSVIVNDPRSTEISQSGTQS